MGSEMCIRDRSLLVSLADKNPQCGGDPVRLSDDVIEPGNLGAVVDDEIVRITRSTFLLGASVEHLSLPLHLVGFLSTTSHVARRGISMVLSSTLVSPGFGRNTPTAITFEITSANPALVEIAGGTPVCHLILARVLPGDPSTLTHHGRSPYESVAAPSAPRRAD